MVNTKKQSWNISLMHISWHILEALDRNWKQCPSHICFLLLMSEVIHPFHLYSTTYPPIYHHLWLFSLFFIFIFSLSTYVKDGKCFAREWFIKIQPNHSTVSSGEAGQHMQLILTEAFWKTSDKIGTLG